MGDGASREVLDTVLASADGNPLFLEERLSSLLETRTLVREQGAWRLSRTAGPQLPQALERLVRSRVDRLSRRPATPSGPRPCSAPSSRCPCWPRCAPPASRWAPPWTNCAPGTAARGARRGEPVYRFRHALIQEATYNGLLRAERRLLHGRAAWALEAAARAERTRWPPSSAGTSPPPGSRPGRCGTTRSRATTPPRPSPTTRPSPPSAPR
jgi:Predicted ATPase